MMTMPKIIGRKVKVRSKPDGAPVYGMVCYQHPHMRFIVVQIPVVDGFVRETLYPRWRRGQT